jgi:hypothetical protein
LVLGWKEFNCTPHFCSLPQEERGIRRMPPHPYPLPRGEEGRKEDEKILTMCPHPDLFPQGGEGEREKDFLKFICEFFNFSLEGKIKF